MPKYNVALALLEIDLIRHVQKFKLYIFTFTILLLGATNSHAQEKTFQPTGSISIDMGIPAKGKNVSFGNVMNGLFNGGITYQYNVFGGLTLGIGAKYSFFVINPFALNNANWGGGLHVPSVHAKLGYERFITERFSLNVGMRAGYSMMVSANDSCKAHNNGPYTESTFFLEPQIELLLLTSKNASGGFSFVLGYDFLFTEFGPRYLCIQNIPNSVEEHYQGITRFLSIGFGYRYYMGRK